MNQEKAQSVLLGLIAIALPSAAAVAVLARAYAYYQGRDGVAGFIVLLMAAGLLVGVGELVQRVRRAASIHRELSALPGQPVEADIERTTPPLRAMLRARLEHAPMPVYGESLTAYLVGLMVMLGLLGTLLGLFETLGGAGHALTASSNVDALRRGLSAPMLGLTRSFGCSAAGVAASAMLGLASVLVKRRELSMVAAVQRYAAGSLRELSPLRRQLGALEQLAAQGAALPAAAAALTGVGDRIDALSERWESTLLRASKAQEEVIRGAFSGLRERVEAAAQAAASSLEAQLAPVLKNSAQATERAAREHLEQLRRTLAADLARKVESETLAAKQAGEALATLAEKLSQTLEAQTERTQAGFSRLFGSLEARDDEHRRALVAQRDEAAALVAAQRDEVAEQVAAQRLEAAAHVAALGDAARALLRQLDDEAKARRAEAGTLLGELAEKLDAASRERAAQSRDELGAIAALGERVAGDVDAREKLRSAAWTELAERVVEMASATRSEEEARLARLDQLASRIGQDLGQLSGAMAKQLETRMEAETALAARSRDTLGIVEQSAQALGSAIAEQRATLDTILSASADQLSELGEKSQAGAVRALARITEVADAQGERFAALSAQITAAHTEQAAGLAGELNSHAARLTHDLAGQADKLGANLVGTGKLVDDAAQVLRATSAEMSVVAELFGKSVERQRETAKTWLESMGELEGVIERVGRGAAADALGDQLASTQEVFARQLQFQRELFEQLRSLRGSPAPAQVRGEHDVSA